MGKRSKNTSVFCGWGEWYWTVTFFSPDPIYCIGRKKSVVFFRMQTKTRPHHLLFLEPNYFNSFIWVGWKHLKHTTQIRTQLLGWYWRLSKTFLIHFSVCKPQEAPTLHCFFPTCLVRSSSFLPSFLPSSFLHSLLSLPSSYCTVSAGHHSASSGRSGARLDPSSRIDRRP